MNKIQKTIIAASLSLNLILLVAINIMGLHRPQPPFFDRPPDIAQMQDFMHHQLSRHLPEQRAAAFVDMMKKTFERLNASTQNIVTQREKLGSIVAAPEFDEEQMRQQAEILSQIEQENHRAVLETIIAFIKTLTPDERKSFAQFMKEIAPPPLAPSQPRGIQQ